MHDVWSSSIKLASGNIWSTSGSILGPLLFIVYIYEVPSQLSFSSALLYADDTKCFKCMYSIFSWLFSASHWPQSAFAWSKQNCLSFNVSKCCLLHFANNCTSPMNCTYQLDNAPIACRNSYKALVLCSQVTFLGHRITWGLLLMLIANLASFVAAFPPLFLQTLKKYSTYP